MVTETTRRTRYAVPTSGADLFRRTALGVFVAILAVLLTRGIARALSADLVGPTQGPTPFDVVPIVTFVVFVGAGAAVAYAALDRLTARPVRNFLVAAGLVFAFLLVPLVTVAPAQGVTPLGQVVLFVFHVVAAVPLVAFVVGAVRL